MFIEEISTYDRRQARQFLGFSLILYKDCEQWVQMLEVDAGKFLDRDRFFYYRESDAAFFMVFSEKNQSIGRIAVLDNRLYNHYNHNNTAFFYLFEILEDFEAAKLLFNAAMSWAKGRGLAEMIEPKGITALNGLGILTRGFEHRPALGIPYNHPYYADFLKRLGFVIDRELEPGYLHRSHKLPEKIHLIAERVSRRWGLQVKRFESRADLRKMLPYFKILYNGSLVDTSGNSPLTDDEVKELSEQILWFADPRLVKVLFKDNQPVGFLLAYPDISAAIKRTGGKLWPFGWIALMQEFRKTKWINVNGAGTLPEFRGMGGAVLLFDEMAVSMREGHYQHADFVQIGIENAKMRREIESIGINSYNTHSIFRQKIL